jgi:hypothetical protein
MKHKIILALVLCNVALLTLTLTACAGSTTPVGGQGVDAEILTLLEEYVKKNTDGTATIDGVTIGSDTLLSASDKSELTGSDYTDLHHHVVIETTDYLYKEITHTMGTDTYESFSLLQTGMFWVDVLLDSGWDFHLEVKQNGAYRSMEKTSTTTQIYSLVLPPGDYRLHIGGGGVGTNSCKLYRTGYNGFDQ